MTDYEELSRWAESDAPQVRPDAVIHRGTPESHAAARALLEDSLDLTDSVTAELVRSTVGGRPSLAADRPAGKSPLWQIRAPQALDEALRARADAEGRTVDRHSGGRDGTWVRSSGLPMTVGGACGS